MHEAARAELAVELSADGDRLSVDSRRRAAALGDREIASEREQLRALIYDLGVTPARYKVVAGWVAEKVSRLKPNGRLGRSSPLTRMIELEALSTGIAGKCRMWRVFEAQIGPTYKGWNFTELAELADSQRERIDALHELAGAWLAETTLARS